MSYDEQYGTNYIVKNKMRSSDKSACVKEICRLRFLQQIRRNLFVYGKKHQAILETSNAEEMINRAAARSKLRGDANLKNLTYSSAFRQLVDLSRLRAHNEDRERQGSKIHQVLRSEQHDIEFLDEVVGSR